MKKKTLQKKMRVILDKIREKIHPIEDKKAFAGWRSLFTRKKTRRLITGCRVEENFSLNPFAAGNMWLFLRRRKIKLLKNKLFHANRPEKKTIPKKRSFQKRCLQPNSSHRLKWIL